MNPTALPVSAQEAFNSLLCLTAPFLDTGYLAQKFNQDGHMTPDEMDFVRQQLNYVQNLHHHPSMGVIINEASPSVYLLLYSTLQLAEVSIRCSKRYQRMLYFRKIGGLNITSEVEAITRIHTEAILALTGQTELRSTESNDIYNTILIRTQQWLNSTLAS